MMLILKRLLIFVCLMVVCIFSISFINAENQNSNASQQVVINPEDIEILEARTPHTKSFRNKAGQNKVFYSSKPLHYLEDGKWRDIDTSIEDATNEVDEDGEHFGFRATKNSIKTYLPKKGKGWVQLRSGNSRLAFKLVAKNDGVLGKRKDGIMFSDIFKNSDLKYSIMKNGLKEEIVLREPSAPRSFEYLIRLHNLTMTKTEANEFLFKDLQGKPLLFMPKFFMIDSNGVISEEIDVLCEARGNGYRLVVSPNKEWLNDPNRKYPVIIDPSYIYYGEDITVKNSGNDVHYYYYIPIGGPLTVNRIENRGGSENMSIYINRPENVRGKEKPYDIKVKYTITMGSSGWGNTASDSPGDSYTSYQPPYFKFIEWNVTNDTPTSRTLASYTFPYSPDSGYPVSKSGEFILKGKDATYQGAARLEIFSGHWQWHTWPFVWIWGLDVQFTIQYQNETMSPPAPVINPMPPESVPDSQGKITVRWGSVIDVDNALTTNNASGTAGYHVQASTDPNFLTNLIDQDVTGTSYGFPGLSNNTTYYFRCYAKDNDWNPLPPLSPWDQVSKPTGVRWSEVTRTKVVSAPAPGGPSKPVINNIAQGTLKGNEYIIKDRNPLITWSSSSSFIRAQLYAVELPKQPKTFIEYPAYASESSTASAQPNNWNLSEGRYVVYVKTANSTSWSPWSDGRYMTIDYTPPVITKGSEVDHITQNHVHVNFTSNEDVTYELYWGKARIT